MPLHAKPAASQPFATTTTSHRTTPVNQGNKVNQGEWVGGSFGPWMLAQCNSRQNCSVRKPPTKFNANFEVLGKERENEKISTKYQAKESNRFNVITNMMDEDFETLGNTEGMDLMEVGTNLATPTYVAETPLVGDTVIRRDEDKVKTHTLYNRMGQEHRSHVMKPNTSRAGPSSTRGPIKNSNNLGSKGSKSPVKVALPPRTRDKNKDIGPLQPSQAHNIQPRSLSRELVHNPPRKTGPDLQELQPKGLSADELLRLLQYGRQKVRGGCCSH